MHGAKGLEYHTVFIIGANEGVIPYKKAKTEEEIEEEKLDEPEELNEEEFDDFEEEIDYQIQQSEKPMPEWLDLGWIMYKRQILATTKKEIKYEYNNRKKNC